MGPPGCKRNEFAAGMAEYFQWESIQTGEALRSESRKSTPTGERIKKCMKDNECVDDDIVVDLVTKKI